MGTDNSRTVSDNGIQNLSRSDIITIQFKKDSYFEGQTVEGMIILEPKQNLVMNDILIKFKQSEYFVYVVDEKNTVSDLNSQTFFEKRLNAGEFLNMGSQMISLTPGSYKFPFQFTLPRDIPPSFEYPFRNRRASLRYTFSAELLSPYVKSLSESYVWIKARPINIPSQIKHENYVKVKNVGFISRGQSGIALFTMANNFRVNDSLPFTIDIYNEECAVQVKEVKISIKRIVTFMKGGKEYQKRTAILRKKYPCLCDKNSKNSFHYDDIQIRDNDLKELDYNRSLNPYPFLDDVNMLMPNVKTNLIKCEYSLKATSYFDLSVLGKDRPRVEMPIYITHQLQKEYEYERDTNQKNGQGQGYGAGNFNNNNWGNSGFGNNNNSFGNNNNNFGNNNNSFGNNNNNFGNNNNSFGNNNNNFGNNNNGFGNNNSNNNFGGGNNNNNKSSGSASLSSSQKFSYEAYIASKKMNTPSTSDKSSNNDSWKSKTTFGGSSNNNNFGFNNNNDNFGNNNNNWGNNNNNNWGNNNNNNNNWGNNNNNNWGNKNNNNNNWGNNNNNNWGNNNNNNWGGNNNYGGNNYNPGSFGGGFNGSANPFGGGSNDFPSLDNISKNNNSNQPSNPFGDNNGPSNPFGNNNNGPSNPFGNNNGPSNPFDNNNGPSNPFGNNNNGPSNPFGNNNNNNNGPSNPFGDNNGNPPNPFGGSGGGSGPYQASYPGF